MKINLRVFSSALCGLGLATLNPIASYGAPPSPDYELLYADAGTVRDLRIYNCALGTAENAR